MGINGAKQGLGHRELVWITGTGEMHLIFSQSISDNCGALSAGFIFAYIV